DVNAVSFYLLMSTSAHHRFKPTLFVGLNSIEVYPPQYWKKFNPNAEFEKWAVVEVADFGSIPEGMESMILPGGRYAVFDYKGPASAAPQIYEYIFRMWLPTSEYVLDDRPHFAVMGDKYKHDDPDSEEEIWIPVELK
ncbi:GyrI-like domain-containing protein, partial [candidate division KSB1 bacterium]|nr:GyrI-like domain-containing protein [candidate division KSB1 bacterium]